MTTHICCFFYNRLDHSRAYLPQVKLIAHTSIVSSVSRTTLTQTFVNPSTKEAIKEARYVFPLYDGVSIVAFTCTIGDRVINGAVKEKQKAREVFDRAVASGETAGLLEQMPDTADIFTTSVGNIPAGASLKVEITYLGELKHDAEVEGIRFTIPTAIAPRYGSYPGELLRPTPEAAADSGIQITVDAEMPNGSTIRAVQSPSHPISVCVGTTSTAPNAEPSLQRASASLALGTAELDKDFIVQVVATNTGNPVAVLEEHPSIAGHRAIMATLVPRFALPAERPEIVFVCDRSGSMGTGQQMPNLISALKIFLKSLPVGTKFNICSFGSPSYSFLWDKSRTYDQTSLEQAMQHVATFAADFGGTEIYQPVGATFDRRYKDMNLEVFLITDGQVRNQERVFTMIDRHVADSNGAIRVFSLGIGTGVSHALIEGVARAGNGFSQAVSENEKMDGKIVRMLKGALTPHVNDYALEVKYEAAGGDDDFEMIDNGKDSLASEREPAHQASLTAGASAEETPPVKKPISLFDTAANPDAEIIGRDSDNKNDYLPTIDIPKILQAPAKIPPLFPFSRTSVYLLISPAATNRTPKSVILRGTSTNGPLELEIPLTTLDAKGETIHQLAARKAVKELEEGRGWLYHAKDADGRALKDVYEGRFSDMAEREAVRLGMQFQVSGKWCPFVAVEPGFEERAAGLVMQQGFNSDLGRSRNRPRGDPSLGYFGAQLPTTSALLRSRPANSLGAVGAAFSPLTTLGSSPRSLAPAAPRSYSPLYSPPSYSTPSYSPLYSPPSYSTPSYSTPSYSTPSYSPPSCSPSLFGGQATTVPTNFLFCDRAAGAPPPVRHSGSPWEGEMLEKPATEPTWRSFGGSALGAGRPKVLNMAYQHKMDVDNFDNDLGTRSDTPLSLLEALVALQTFDGYWAWSDNLLNMLGLEKTKIGKVLEATGVPWGKTLQDVANRNVVATGCVVVYLRTKLAAEKDSWELMADKAVDWLSASLRGVGVSIEELERCLAALFRGDRTWKVYNS